MTLTDCDMLLAKLRVAWRAHPAQRSVILRQARALTRAKEQILKRSALAQEEQSA